MPTFSFILDLLPLAIICASLSYTLVRILFSADMLLHNFALYMEKVLPHFVFKGLFGCSTCLAGQMALWSYIIISFVNFEYSLITHIILISFSMIIANILTKING